MSEAVYYKLLSSVEILYLTVLAENHADLVAYYHSKMIVLMVRELSQTSPLCIFYMLKYMSILLNSAIITAFSLLNQAFSKLNIPKYTFFPSELEFLNLYQSGYPSPDNFTELMN